MGARGVPPRMERLTRASPEEGAARTPWPRIRRQGFTSGPRLTIETISGACCAQARGPRQVVQKVMDDLHEDGHGSGSTERWLLTYSDMITLLMVFFIILYAMSKTDVAQYRAIAVSLRQALSGQPLSRGLPQDSANALVSVSPVPGQTPQVAPSSSDVLIAQMAQEIRSILQSQGQQGQASVQVNQTGLDIAFQGDSVYFASASAVLTPTFQNLLRRIAPVLKQSPNEIRVEGYTNNLPLHSTLYPTAWELSGTRAINVLRYLTEICGVPPHQMEADAFGQWHPAYPNDTPANLALNRSVHIVVTKQAPPGLDQGGPDVAP